MYDWVIILITHACIHNPAYIDSVVLLVQIEYACNALHAWWINSKACCSNWFRWRMNMQIYSCNEMWFCQRLSLDNCGCPVFNAMWLRVPKSCRNTSRTMN